MNFGFTEEQELLRKTARDFLAECAPVKHAREVMESDRSHSPEAWGRMAELGWTGLPFAEEFGGAGLGTVELCIVLEELGRVLAPVPFLPTVLAGAAIHEVGTDAQRHEWLPGICRGDTIGTVAIAEERGTDEPSALALRAERSGDGFTLRGLKRFVPDADDASLLLVAARTGDDPERDVALFVVPRDAAGLDVTPLKSMDLLRPLYEVALDGVALPGSALLGGEAAGGAGLRRCLDRGMVMICAEMLGGAEKCLEDSVAYAKERVQFGKPIGVNQAIKHKCADMLFEVESARSITYFAAWAAGASPEEAPLAAAMAKAFVSDAYRAVSAENIQIHGGVGFTWEYDCHLYFKRAKSDESWLGDGSRHRERVARMLRV